MTAPTRTKRQRKRSEWLCSATKWRRVGAEYEFEEVLITRMRRKPPMYKLEAVSSKGVTVVGTMLKAEKGFKGYSLLVPGPQNEPLLVRFATRKQAIRAFFHSVERREPAVEAAPEGAVL